MARDIRAVVADINAFDPADPDDLDLDRVQTIAQEFFETADADAHLDVWFRLFERFPEFDGHGVFWTILHGLETLPGCDAAVVASVSRRPSRFPLLMVNRMLNAGTREVAGRDLLALLGAVAGDDLATPAAREHAAGFVEFQRRRAAEPGSV